ncbi:MAG: class I SAM-dependent methyltransferase [Deltaproteobacteria bacterium]|nr:class I SAM-dependent methyltransferase [Deltaproteobacteria bacterium]
MPVPLINKLSMTIPETETLDACPNCGSKEKRFLFTNTDRLHGIPGEFGLNRCMNCAAVYLSPRPTIEALPRYYPDDYGPHQTSEQAFTQSETMRGSMDFHRNTILSEVYHYKDYGNRPRIKTTIVAKLVAYLSFPLWKRARYGLSRITFPPYVQGEKTLDIGCGTGSYLKMLRNLGWEVYG